MKKILTLLVTLCCALSMTCLSAEASVGNVKKSTVVKYKGNYYGNHCKKKNKKCHWHRVKKNKKGQWYVYKGQTKICYKKKGKAFTKTSCP
ncbi:MAG: hypothetical protein LBR40_06100 [Bacilli bacterium]|jgi:hypothetical protein|nr:hypothetical protein [Bacilli bacterium]